VVATTLFLPLSTTASWACSCAVTTPEEQADDARVVFTGRVRKVDRSDVEQGQGTIRVRFRVGKVYKGAVDRHVEVITASNGAACGCHFKEGVRYTVFGSRRSEPIPTNLCSGTKRGPIDPSEYGLPPGSAP